MTPRSWAWASASASASPIRSTSRSDTAPAASSCASVLPRTSSETRKRVPSSSPASKTDDDPGVVEPGDGVRLAPRAVVGTAVGGDRLDRHRAPAAARRAPHRPCRSRPRRSADPVGSAPGRVTDRPERRALRWPAWRAVLRRGRRDPPSRRNGACGPLRRRDGHTSRLVLLRRGRRAPEQLLARAEARRWATPPPTSRRCWSVALVAFGGLLAPARRCCSSSSARARARARRTRSRTTTARSPRSCRSPTRQVGAPFFELLGQAGDESPQDLQTNISGYRVQAEAQLKQARRPRRPGRDDGRPAVAADGARVPPRRARLHRRAHPHRARGRGRRRQRGDHGDRRPDADVPGLRRPLPGAHRAVHQERARRRARSAARRSRPRASCRGSSG